MVNNITVKEKPLITSQCNDGVSRNIGQIRLTPEIVMQTQFDHSFDKLPAKNLTGDDIFTWTPEEGVLLHELNLPHKFQLYSWNTVWITVAIETEPILESLPTSQDSSMVLYSPRQDLYCIEVKPEEESAEETRIKIGSLESITNSNSNATTTDSVIQCTPNSLSFVEIPDGVIMDQLDGRYTPQITAQLM